MMIRKRQKPGLLSGLIILIKDHGSTVVHAFTPYIDDIGRVFCGFDIINPVIFQYIADIGKGY